MTISLLTGQFIKPQLLIVCGSSAADFWKWLKGYRGNALRHTIVGRKTEFTQIEDLDMSDFSALLWMKFQKLRFRR